MTRILRKFHQNTPFDQKYTNKASRTNKIESQYESAKLSSYRTFEHAGISHRDQRRISSKNEKAKEAIPKTDAFKHE